MGKRVLLFDLGGVLIKLRIAESLQAMAPAHMSWEEIKAILLQNPTVRLFDVGECTPEAFAQSFIDDLNLKISIEDFLTEFATWPVGFFDGAREMLRELRQTCSVNCLSNTNEIHWKQDWVDQFDNAFASHLIGAAKPDAAAFDYVIDSLGVAPDEIYFFDDSKVNVEAAQVLGMSAYHTDGFDELKTKIAELSLTK